MELNSYDWAYIIGGMILLTWELRAIYMKWKHGEAGNTISHRVNRWIRVNPKVRRILVGVGCLWLFWHFVIQPF